MTSHSLPHSTGAAISSGRGRPTWIAALVIAAAIVAAYVTSFRGALVFDDLPGIANNPTIRDLSHPELLLVAIGPQGGTLSGRPVPNFTLALNYAISGDELWSYHAANLLIHVAAALTLFGIVRRTLLRPLLAEHFGSNAGAIALGVALLWGVHPLQTESVTYLVQRVESLMGLFYLLTLYCFLRAIDSPEARRGWYVRAFFACLFGMGCKEVMVTAPVVVALYDRTFVAGSWREALRTRWKFYGALLSTWIALGGLVVASGGRGGTAGYEVGVNAWSYLLTQCEVIIDYVKLSFWPFFLAFDHNVPLALGISQVWPQALVLCALLGTTVYFLIRRPVAGFLCATFFLILAPTSSIVPVADAMVEHRMYLPLAVIVTFVVVGMHRQSGRLAPLIWSGLAVVLGATTAIRNLDYRSPLTLWEDTVKKIPGSPRAHNNLGAYLLSDGRLEAAREHFSTALRLKPNYASAHYNFGQLLEKTGQVEEAIQSYETATRLNPKLVDAHVNSARLLDRVGR
ncbi:MAG: tetratricopeptide repeat protein, partial [Opitutaceae bacterium]